MINALFYKEWTKLHRLLFGALACSLLLVGYIWSELAYVFRNNGAVVVWDAVLHQGFIFFGMFRYMPIALGILLGLFQWVPEMQHKRLKLAMHLPSDSLNVLFSHIVIGSIMYWSIAGVSALLLWEISTFYFPSQIVFTVVITCLPWLLAGWILYLITSYCTVEPIWSRRAAYFILGLLNVYFYYYASYTNAYALALPILSFFTIAFLPAIFYSGMRFKKGERK